MKNVQQWLLPFAKPFSLNHFIHLSGQRLLLPFYHSIQDKAPLPHLENLYPLRTKKQFEADLDYLLEHYEAISLSELVACIDEDKEIRKNSFFLSFDDGLRACYELIAPILKRKGIPACFFLNSAFVDNQKLFYRYKVSLLLDQINRKPPSKSLTKKLETILQKSELEGWTMREQILSIDYQQKDLTDELAQLLKVDFKKFLAQEQPYLTTPQIRAMEKDGFQFGAHSIDHPLYEDLSPLDQIIQTKESLHFVETHCRQPIRSFAFPFTDDGVAASFFDKMHQEQILDISFGTAGLKKDSCPFHFQRLPMEVGAYSAAEILKSTYAYYLAKAPFGKNLVLRS